MALKISKESETAAWVEAQETLWLTADRDRVVADGDPDAAFLLATPGKRISTEDAEKYGLVASKKVAKPEAEKTNDEPPAKPLKKMNREELNKRALDAGIADAADETIYANKAALVEAIEKAEADAETPDEEVA